MNVPFEHRLLSRIALIPLAACFVSVLSWMLAALTYTSHGEDLRWLIGLTLQHFRPIHETYAFAWVFLGGVTVVYFYLYSEFGPFSPAMTRRIVVQFGLWLTAGTGILITLLSGQFSGKEYIAYHPAFSLLILIGWLVFAWNFFQCSGFRLRGKPVYIYMWSVSLPLSVITFTEGHLYLLEFLTRNPVRDLAIQWRSNGILVGSFNLLAYGSLMYISGRIQRDDRYAHSRTAFALFSVGVLNTFTNFGHHTFHLPQSPWIHWISFSISMLETLILVKVVMDLLSLLRGRIQPDDFRVPGQFIRSAGLWTFFLLVMSLAISIPPLNALIHGTHVVVAHSMGSMLGIDSMILWAGLSYVLQIVVGPNHRVVATWRVRSVVPFLNLMLAVFLLSWLANGAAAGWVRYFGPSAPDFSYLFWIFPIIMSFAGTGLAAAILWVLWQWTVAFWSVARQSVPPRHESSTLASSER